MTVFTADGKRLARGQGGSYSPVETVKQLKRALAEFKAEEVSPKLEEDPDLAGLVRAPEDGLIFYVTWKILGPSSRGVIGTDRLWARKDEAVALAGGSFPKSLAKRMLRDHIGYLMSPEAPGFDPILEGKALQGSFLVKDREHPADYRGVVESKNGKVTRFDLLVKGWGRGMPGDGGFSLLTEVPKGTFVPLALQFELADPGEGLAQVLPARWQSDWYLK